ncbi:MAG: AraC family transcriptional regulator [Phycisphaeraceae bacterium]|nr:AraC family transcriptional regulator [Phycisphaeraceae bacterium]
MTNLPWMNHQAISDSLQDTFLYPQKWRLISSLIPLEESPVTSPEHQQWSQRNTHYHNYQEILIALSGTCTYGFRDRVYPCRPGSIFLFDLNEPHDCGYDPSASNLLHVWIRFLGKHIITSTIEVHQGKYKQIPGSPLLRHLNETGTLLAKNWAQCRNNPQWPDSLTRLTLISALGIMASDIVKTELPTKTKRRNKAVQEHVINEICNHINTTGGSGISLDVLAQTAGYNKFHLSRLFQAKVGCTIHQYIDQCRSKWVKDLLEQGYTKKRISEQLGFSSPTAFSRWLKHNPQETEKA